MSVVSESWREIGSGVFVRRHESFDLNIGLVLGEGQCLVIDTRADERQGAELAAAVRRVTAHPWVVVNTHAHFDHFFGNRAMRPANIWGHVRCKDFAERYGAMKRERISAAHRDAGEVEAAGLLASVRIDPPDHTFEDTTTLSVGGREVELRYLGRAHTDHDIVVRVPDADVVFAGDMIEEGACPQFGDSFPLDWPDTLQQLLPLATGPLVPGHGDVVDRAFAQRQAADLATVAHVARQAHRDRASVDAAWATTGLPEEHARPALLRAWRQLDGAPAYDPA